MNNIIICDLNRCIGCLSCSVACKMENGGPCGTSRLRVERIGPNTIEDGGRFPDVEMYFLPLMCQHCADPGCVDVCASGALYRTESGTVRLDEAKCVGCRLCLDACMYDSIYFDEQREVAGKCMLCGHLTERSEEPMCVAQCGGEALKFGDLDEPGSEVTRMLAEAGQNAHSLCDSGMQPRVRYILRKAQWRGQDKN